MKNDFDRTRIMQTAGTIAELFGIDAPQYAEEPIEQVLEKANEMFNGEKADRILMYNPDAVALWLFEKYTPFYNDLLQHIQIKIPVRTVMPSVTPVCFASMYTGATPDIHGIQSYTKPILKIDTIFDAMIRAGKKPVIISTEGDSVSKIFLEREMDYFIFETFEECNEKAFELIKEDNYDLIVLYNGNYDTQMHHHSPEGEESIDALKKNIHTFDMLAEAIKSNWTSHNTVLAFATDHGCHEIDGKMGSHGLDMPEDMNVMHFYSMFPRK